jgi:hypothetical protein
VGQCRMWRPLSSTHLTWANKFFLIIFILIKKSNWSPVSLFITKKKLIWKDKKSLDIGLIFFYFKGNIVFTSCSYNIKRSKFPCSIFKNKIKLVQYSHYIVYFKGKKIEFFLVNLVMTNRPLKKTIIPLTPRILIFLKWKNSNCTITMNNNMCLGVQLNLHAF